MSLISKDGLDTKSAEELFEDYIDTLYQQDPKLKTPKYQILVEALKDAFMAGMTIATCSSQDFTIELLSYARTAIIKTTDKLTPNVDGYIN